MDQAERVVYEKILAAYYAAEEHPGLSQDDFLFELLTTEERNSDAYRVFEYLQGRSSEFAAFLCQSLGFTHPAEAQTALTAQYGPLLQARIDRHATTGR